MRPAIKVGLSTASVYPLRAEAAFAYAAELGYDGVELMVWAEPLSQNVVAVAELSRRYGVPVLSVHAPCLLISQRVWGSDPIAKLEMSVAAAERLGAATVVVHPPFRWQRRYAEGFSDQVARLEQRGDMPVAVENMFPFHADRFFGPPRVGAGGSGAVCCLLKIVCNKEKRDASCGGSAGWPGSGGPCLGWLRHPLGPSAGRSG